MREHRLQTEGRLARCNVEDETMGNKIKPHKGILKRIKIGGTGTVRRKQAGKTHLMSSKAGKRRRRLKGSVGFASGELKRVRRMLGMG